MHFHAKIKYLQGKINALNKFMALLEPPEALFGRYEHIFASKYYENKWKILSSIFKVIIL